MKIWLIIIIIVISISCKPHNTELYEFDPRVIVATGLFNDIDAGPRFYPKKQVNDSVMAMWIEAKQLKDHVASDDFKKAVDTMGGYDTSQIGATAFY